MGTPHTLLIDFPILNMSSFYVKSIVRKIDLNSTLMESNPAYYQDPEDVRVEVGQVGSGPNQEHLTDQVMKLLFFDPDFPSNFWFWIFPRFLDFILFFEFSRAS